MIKVSNMYVVHASIRFQSIAAFSPVLKEPQSSMMIGVAYLLHCSGTHTEVGPRARDIVPPISTAQQYLPVNEVSMIEDVGSFVIIVEVLRRQHQGNAGVMQLQGYFGEEVWGTNHVTVKNDNQLHEAAHRTQVRSSDMYM